MTRHKLPVGHGKTRIGFVYINLGSDGDQWIISPTKDGGIVVTHVPPREPVTGGLTNIASVLIEARKTTAQQINEHFQTSADSGKQVIEGIAMLGREQVE
jgi:hypothetical protein